jgi:hypothetical protein
LQEQADGERKEYEVLLYTDNTNQYLVVEGGTEGIRKMCE